MDDEFVGFCFNAREKRIIFVCIYLRKIDIENEELIFLSGEWSFKFSSLWAWMISKHNDTFWMNLLAIEWTSIDYFTLYFIVTNDFTVNFVLWLWKF